MAGVHLFFTDCLPGLLNSNRVVSDRGRFQRMYKIATFIILVLVILCGLRVDQIYEICLQHLSKHQALDMD